MAFDRAENWDDFAAVRLLLEEASARFSEMEDKSGQSYALNALGNVLTEQQDYKAAQAVLAVALSSQGEHRTASALLKEALAQRLEMGDKRNAAIALAAAASLLAAQGRGAQAARLWGTAEALRAKIGFSLTPRQEAAHGRLVAETREAAGSVPFSAAWNAGQALSWEQAIEDARSALD